MTTIAIRFEENRQVNFFRSWDAVRGVALDQTTDHADYVQVGQTDNLIEMFGLVIQSVACNISNFAKNIWSGHVTCNKLNIWS